MPNRVIKDSVKRSEEIDSLTWFEEVVFYRLIVTADDYGRYHANPILLRSDLFPMKESLAKKDVASASDKLESVGLIYRYEVDGKQYLQITNWEKHQRVRKSVQKFPPPPPRDISPQLAATCRNLPQLAAVIQSESESESESGIQSESESNARGRGGIGKYLSDNLLPMSPGNYEALRSLMEDGIGEDMVRYAVDIATANGARTWAYVQSILNRWLTCGIQSVSEAQREHEARKGRRDDGPQEDPRLAMLRKIGEELDAEKGAMR